MTKTLLGVTLLCLSCIGSIYAREANIIVYGQNAPEWNKDLGVNGTRSSCNAEPAACMKTVAALLSGQHTDHFYLNLPTDPEKAPAYAEFYSKASREQPQLREIDLDDFVDHFNTWCHTSGVHCDRLMNQIIDNVKSNNPKLRFGITVYETEIASLVANPKFPPELRRRIDTVHLYIINRADGPRFENYVKQVKENFPNAEVIAGVYAYDRLDFEKCHGCSAADARDLQKQTLRAQVRLLQQGEIAGLEFYPGHFGWEDKFSGWSDPNECAPARRHECINNTKAMRDDAVVILRELKK